MQHFADLPDPRVLGRTTHPLMSLVLIALCAVVSGAQGWQDIADFAQDRKDWLAGWLALPNGVPSECTFRRVLSALEPKTFHACVRSWVASLAQPLQGQVVAFDGKVLLGALRRTPWGKCLHQVHVWAVKQRLLLAHQAVDGACDEPKAIRRLLDLIALPGALATGDAAYCSRPMAQSILDAGADYLLQLKGNRAALYHAVEAFFQRAHADRFAHWTVRHVRSQARGHGREEIREAWSVAASAVALPGASWPSMRSLTQIVRTRVVKGHRTEHTHYYVSSLPPKVRTIASAAREHWGVENNLHWVLDVQMGEDSCVVRDELGAQNLATLRRLSLQMLQQDSSYTRGIAAKRAKAARCTEDLEHILRLGI